MIFPAAEFRARITRLQTEMAGSEIDALLLTTPGDIFYATGFLTRFWESPARPWFLVVPRHEDPIAVIPVIGSHLMAQTWIQDIRTWDAPYPGDDGVTLLAEAIRECVSETGTVGIPMGMETHVRMPGADAQRLFRMLEPRRILDGTNSIQRTREIKSDAEVAKIRDICKVADTAFSRVHEIAKVGRPLDAIFRDFQGLALQSGADWVSYLAGAAGVDGYEDVISPATPTPLETGDVLMLDLGAVRDGYFCDFDRNFAIGTTSDAVRRTQEALWAATEDALNALRPGMLAKEAHSILAKGIEVRGARPCAGRLGHGLGVNLTEWPSFTPLDQTELRENMVLTLEPSACVTGGRFLVHEENIVLRADGPELLSTRSPQTMQQL